MFVLLLPYCMVFLRMKLKNLYIKIGTGTSTQYLPAHELSNILGLKQCRNLLKACVVTGCIWLTKLGTKSNALHKVDLLNNFGESRLITTWLMLLKNISCLYWKEKTFDEYNMYHEYNAVSSICNVPRSNSITGSIFILYSKWAYNVSVQFNTLFIIIVECTFCLNGPA